MDLDRDPHYLGRIFLSQSSCSMNPSPHVAFYLAGVLSGFIAIIAFASIVSVHLTKDLKSYIPCSQTHLVEKK